VPIKNCLGGVFWTKFEPFLTKTQKLTFDLPTGKQVVALRTAGTKPDTRTEREEKEVVGEGIFARLLETPSDFFGRQDLNLGGRWG